MEPIKPRPTDPGRTPYVPDHVQEVPMPPLMKTPSKKPISKVAAAMKGAAVLVALPVLNWIAAQLGLPALTPESAGELYDVLVAVYGSVAAAIPVIVAYLKSPKPSDAPVPK